jgi:hypothetical protein
MIGRWVRRRTPCVYLRGRGSVRPSPGSSPRSDDDARHVASLSHRRHRRATNRRQGRCVEYLTDRTLPRFIRTHRRALLCFNNRLEPSSDAFAARLSAAAELAAIPCGAVEVRHFPAIAADFGVVQAPVTAVLLSQRLALLEFGVFDHLGVAALIETVLSYPER